MRCVVRGSGPALPWGRRVEVERGSGTGRRGCSEAVDPPPNISVLLGKEMKRMKGALSLEAASRHTTALVAPNPLCPAPTLEMVLCLK